MNDKLPLQSADITGINIEKIAALFPHCVTETAEGKKIDFDLLKQELSADVVEGNKERYRLEWPGKREAIVTANLPTNKTLRPVREDSVDFDTTENIYIEGDNLEVLKLLQESYLGKIKMIYIDPPYNTGKDFVYKDNFAKSSEEELFESGQKDEYNQRLVVNPETSGRYHSDWLSMMYPRLKLARNLLTDDGVIFISIDDNEVHNLRKICDEIFGEGNFVGQYVWRKKYGGGQAVDYFVIEHEYITVYRKTERLQWVDEIINDDASSYNKKDQNGNYKLVKLEKWGNTARREDRPTMYFSLIDPENNRYYPIAPDGGEGRWRVGKEKMENLINNNLIFWERKGEKFIPYEKIYFDPLKVKSIKDRSILYYIAQTGDGTNELTNIYNKKDLFENPKSVKLINKIIGENLLEHDIILDFFSGSATTAHAVMQLNSEDGGKRKYIMVQLPEATDEKSEAYKAGYKNICEIGKERIRRAAKSIMNEQLRITNNQLRITNEQLGIKKDEGTLFSNAKEDNEAVIRNSKNRNLDLGFRVYRLDSSNMQDVYYAPQDYQQNNLDLFADNVKPDRSAEDLVTQIMLDWGLELSLPFERKTIAGKEVYAVEDNSLYCCFDTDIDEAFAKAVAQDQPLRIVFRDKGFKDDTAKENVKQLLKQLAPGTEMKVV